MSILPTPSASSQIPHAAAKDFAYDSGERQVATTFGEIRRDHASRYLLATLILKNHFARAIEPLHGLDLFCGNGYGSWLAATELGAHVVGIDGSAEAIAVANAHFSTARTLYAVKCFPFDLPDATYDFITCYESIEHVSEPEALFALLAKSLKPGGVLFVSTPNEATMPLALNAAWFRHHVRHFREQELIALAEKQPSLRYAGRFGQNVYRLDQGRVIGLDETLDQAPSATCPAPHFFIQIFMKT